MIMRLLCCISKQKEEKVQTNMKLKKRACNISRCYRAKDNLMAFNGYNSNKNYLWPWLSECGGIAHVFIVVVNAEDSYRLGNQIITWG